MRRLLLLLAVALPAAAHPSSAPTVWVDIMVKDHEVEMVAAGLRDVIGPWLNLDLSPERPTTDEAKAQLQGGLAALFSTRNTVAIDGTVRAARVRSFGTPVELEDPNPERFVEIVMVFPCSTPPQSVAILWRTFEGAHYGQDEPVVPGLVRYGPAIDTISLTREEPEYTWHRENAERPAPVLKRIEAPAPPRPPFPWLAVGTMAAACLGAVYVRRRGPAALAAVLLVGAASAAFAWPHAEPGARLPPEMQARRIFLTLHGNVYRAFEATTEDEIYELLAASVEESLVESIYLDVYESLILRQYGGAVTKIERIEVEDGTVRLPDDGRLEFEVEWKWRVHCAVTHWGHTHRRINAYRADFTVRHDASTWKIATMRVLEYERIDPDE